MNQDDIALIKIAAATATAFAAVLTAFYVVIMRPLIGLLQAKIVAEMRTEFIELRTEIKAFQADMKVEFAELRTAMKLEMAAMEKRLNDRINTYVIKH